jgi:hypothetical protein
METQELHAQKVTILSRLIKESSLTLEEALLLLKEEEQVEEDVVQEPKYVPQTGTSTWTTTPYTVSYPIYQGSGTMPLTGTNVTFTTTSNTIADSSADLNT